MRLTKCERAMLLVALDCVIVEYRKAGKRAARRKMDTTAEMCADADARYSALARKLALDPPRSTKGRRTP